MSGRNPPARAYRVETDAGESYPIPASVVTALDADGYVQSVNDLTGIVTFKAGANVTLAVNLKTNTITISASGGGGGAVSSVTGTSPIVASPTTGAVVVDFNNWYEGNGPPTIVAPVDSIYRDLTTPGLWQCYAETPGSPGLFLTQKADGATNIYRCAEGSGTTLVDAIGGQNATFTGGSYVSALSADQAYALALNGTGGITFPFDDPPGILSATKYTIEFVVKFSSLPGSNENLFYNTNASGFAGLNSNVSGGGSGSLGGNYGGNYPGFSGSLSSAIAIVCLEYDSTQPGGMNSRATVNTTTSAFNGGLYNGYRASNSSLTLGVAVSGLLALGATVQSIAFYPFLLTPTQHANHVAALSNAGYADWRQFVVTGEAASSVTGIQVSGNPILVGDVTLVAATGAALVQSGNTISIGLSSGSNAYDATILAESSLTHYWKLNDAAGSSAAADSKGSTNLPVVGSPIFGCRAITADGESCIQFPGTTTDYLTFPSGLIPATGDYTIEFVIKPVGYTDTSLATGTCVVFDADASNDITLNYEAANSTGVAHVFGASAGGYVGTVGPVAFQTPTLVQFVVSGSSTLFYFNGVKTVTYGAAGRQSSAGKVGTYAYSVHYGYLGYMAKLAVYSSALSQAQIAAHYANL